VDALARLRNSITRHAGEGRTATALPGVGIVCSRTTTEPLCGIAEPTLAVVVQGVKKTTLNGCTYTYGTGQFLVVSVDLPVIGHITQGSPDRPFLAFVLELRAQMIAALLLETGPAAAPGSAAADAVPSGLAVSDTSPTLLDAIARLLALLDAPDDAAALAAGFEREILWRLITGPHGATVRQIGLADSRLAHLTRAIRWIRSHYNETLRVEELAALATMSVSSFHRQFRAVTSMSPIQFQKQIQLQEARARLLAEPGDVTGVGFAVATPAPRSSAGNTAACSAYRLATTPAPCGMRLQRPQSRREGRSSTAAANRSASGLRIRLARSRGPVMNSSSAVCHIERRKLLPSTPDDKERAHALLSTSNLYRTRGLHEASSRAA
jgi:AraC-like DNA-binding protein